VALGRRAALATVVGNAAGCYCQVVAVALGIGALVERSAAAFSALKLAGAAYLIFLGVRTLLRRKELAAVVEPAEGARNTRRILREGFLVGLTNPKTTVFFAGILPQFTDPARGHVPLQLLFLGLVFVAIALVSDSAWGIAAGSGPALAVAVEARRELERGWGSGDHRPGRATRARAPRRLARC
jgi:threonine/homoserine/homoserine lactone efflux protein